MNRSIPERFRPIRHRQELQIFSLICYAGRYFTNNARHVDADDRLYVPRRAQCRHLMVNARRLMQTAWMTFHPCALSEVQCLAFIAHNNLLDIGRESDWGAHRIEHERVHSKGITHGEGMAVVTIAWARCMAAHHPDKLAQLASRIFGVDPFVYTKEDMAISLRTGWRNFPVAASENHLA